MSSRKVGPESGAATPDAGVLYVVSTPIGNLEDLTFRALRVLREVDLVAAEDTRHSRKLFNHYGIDTPLTSYFQHNETSKGEVILEKLRQGQSVALISDAGTPAISDPGYHLVQRCRAEGLDVRSVPGASALVAALSVSGLSTDSFVFAGFVPTKKKHRDELVRHMQEEKRTFVCYESPRRLDRTLELLEERLGAERRVAVARELTKVHEELVTGTLAEVRQHFAQAGVRGEIVLLVSPAEARQPDETVQQALIRVREQTGLPMRQVVKEVARQFGLPGSDVYRESLKLGETEGN